MHYHSMHLDRYKSMRKQQVLTFEQNTSNKTHVPDECDRNVVSDMKFVAVSQSDVLRLCVPFDTLCISCCRADPTQSGWNGVFTIYGDAWPTPTNRCAPSNDIGLQALYLSGV